MTMHCIQEESFHPPAGTKERDENVPKLKNENAKVNYYSIGVKVRSYKKSVRVLLVNMGYTLKSLNKKKKWPRLLAKPDHFSNMVCLKCSEACFYLHRYDERSRDYQSCCCYCC